MHTHDLHMLKPGKEIVRTNTCWRRRVNFQGHGSQPVVVVCVLNPSPQEVKAGRSLILRQACFTEEFQDSQGYSGKPCFKNKTNTTATNNKTRKIKGMVLGRLTIHQLKSSHPRVYEHMRRTNST